MINIKKLNLNKFSDESYFKRNKKQKVYAWLIFSVFAIYAASLLIPFIWIFMNSLKTERFFTQSFTSFPKEMFFKNYYTAFMYRAGGTYMYQMFFNSVIVCFLSTLATVITSSCAAYVVAKYKFFGRNIIYGIVIFSLIVPIVGTLPAQFRLMETLKLYDTYVGIVFIYSGGFGLNFLLLYGFFKNLSWNYAEAAGIDGAGDFTIFTRIMIPLAKPAIISVAVLTFIGLWNEYTVPRIFLPSNPTLAVGLFELSETLKNDQLYTVLFAAIILALIPIITIFAIFQKTIMTNTVAGGLKG